MKTFPLLLPLVFLLTTSGFSDETAVYPKAKVNMDDYIELVSVVYEHRKERLVDLVTFLEMSEGEDVVILDTRSKYRYDRIHLKGAIHLNFSDFTVANLKKLIPSPETTVLIYCNNNFEGNQVDFASKVALMPSELSLNPLSPELLSSIERSPNPQPPAVPGADVQFKVQERPLMLALNIPTYINLYGYGYRNVYELNELVDVTDSRIRFEGSILPEQN